MTAKLPLFHSWIDYFAIAFTIIELLIIFSCSLNPRRTVVGLIIMAILGITFSVIWQEGRLSNMPMASGLLLPVLAWANMNWSASRNVYNRREMGLPPIEPDVSGMTLNPISLLTYYRNKYRVDQARSARPKRWYDADRWCDSARGLVASIRRAK